MRLLIPLFACTTLLMAACQEQPASSQGDATATPDQLPASGLRAYKDPVTGELTTPPEDEIRRQNLESNINTMDVRKSESIEMIPLEGGGYLAPLDDRFQVESRATIDADGSIVIEESIKQTE